MSKESKELGIEMMDHDQAVKQMYAERYLLNELQAEEREAFEEHVFECEECALDLRAAAAFVDEAKVQLPRLLASESTPGPVIVRPNPRDNRGWFSRIAQSMRAAYTVPAFALLLLVAGYQNLVTLPSLRANANQPQLLASIPLHGATRGDDRLIVNADRKHGIVLPFEFFSQPDAPAYSAYLFDLSDSQGKLAWTGTIAASDDHGTGDQRISLVIPAAMMQNGSYTVAVYGVDSHGQRAQIQKQAFDLHLAD